MTKIYAASELPGDEYTVLDCLAAATEEGEAPVSESRLLDDYALIEDVADAEMRLGQILASLRSQGLAGRDQRSWWFATRLGRDVMQFSEKTAREE